ncbi:DNA polymerase subunit gamma-2, mitochondrial isoform X2 [Eurosta solidaginis]|uniref:DNA polymerase subunit gamma-2, mitochondrial isoform X2 n=1 Tax=Eurosta solidaginis TaxID=178769 RepID=UPI003531464C
MQQIKKIIEKLRATSYLTASIDANDKLKDIRLLNNGMKYSEQLLKHWQQTHTLDKEAVVKFMDINVYDYDHSIHRYNFINTAEFQNRIKHLRDTGKIILKSIQTIYADKTSIDPTLKRVLLVTDVIHPAKGLNIFFNAQRSSKIWWMRFSADPSRYLLEPYNFNAASESHIVPGTQAVAIKSQFPYAIYTVEDITCIPFNGTAASTNDIKELTNVDSCQTKNITPGVIRSVIDLHAAATAIIFDSVCNERENTLLLHRKLAPYQCAVTCFHRERAGLRLLNETQIFTKSQDELDAELEKCDNLGIPYTLIIRDSTLKNGLLKLRSRDTTLEETIHISDLPDYLLQIFNS